MKRVLATAAVVAATVVAPAQFVIAGAASAAPVSGLLTGSSGTLADVANPAIDLGSVEIPLDGSCSPSPCPNILSYLLSGSSEDSSE
ncbi:hypothetical protein [Nocardia rhizosphaerae]|uniref:Small secreted domain n=1 Tax=Nocardia rhizosphaerae TaxID=1691571 RepID=A0ABV8L8P8_9NOCA